MTQIYRTNVNSKCSDLFQEIRTFLTLCFSTTGLPLRLEERRFLRRGRQAGVCESQERASSRLAARWRVGAAPS